MIDQMEHHFILFSTLFLFVGLLLGFQLRQMSELKRYKNMYKPGYEEEFGETYKPKRPKYERHYDEDENEEEKPKKRKISIDDTTHVVSINTSGLEKQCGEIGQSKTTDEDVSESINKLKNLKRGE